MKGNQITNNIFIAYKILKFLRRGRSKVHHMTITIDTSKACDGVKWPMVIAMIKIVEFSEKCIKWV